MGKPGSKKKFKKSRGNKKIKTNSGEMDRASVTFD